MTYKVAHELFRDNVADAAILIAKHWKEFYGQTGFRTDFGGIVDTETLGGFKYFTLRDEKANLVGHLGMMVQKLPYYGKHIAMDIFYYIDPSFRGTTAICSLLKTSARILRSMGIEQVNLSHPIEKDLEPVLKRSGFRKAHVMYTFGE